MPGLRRQMLIYGRGLTAVLTKAVFSDRRRALDILRRVPAGVSFMLSPSSAKNVGKQDYPVELARREWLGAAVGPAAYAVAARRQRRAEPVGHR
jgi:hypothetical protein